MGFKARRIFSCCCCGSTRAALERLRSATGVRLWYCKNINGCMDRELKQLDNATTLEQFERAVG